MELKRYAIFAGLSLAIHSAAFSASYKPLTISPITSTAGQSVSIQFIAPAPTVEQNTATDLTKESPISKTETVAKPKAVSTTKPQPKVEPVLAKSVQPKVNPEKQKTKPVEAAQLKNDSVTQAKTPNKPEPKQLASQESPSESVKPKSESPVTTSSATSASPKLITKPTFETRPSAIDYPRSAKRRNIQGVVLVEVWLDPEGDQTKLLIVNSSGHQVLDSAALKGIAEWQFRQHQNDGQAIAHRVQIPVNFKLN